MIAKRKSAVPVDQTTVPAGWRYCPGTRNKYRIHEIACSIRQRDGWGCTEKCEYHKSKKVEVV